MGVITPIRRFIVTLAAGCLALGCAMSVGRAQTSGAARSASDSSRCDSIVAAARVDSISVGFFVSAIRIDGGAFDRAKVATLQSVLGSAFIAPRPFRLTVFSGTARPRFLRIGRDTAVLHAPTVTGTYRVWVAKPSKVARIAVLRASLMQGLDTAAAMAIRSSSLVDDVMAVPDGEDSMVVDVSFSSDSVSGARRLATAWFPRMPVVDALPPSTNVPLKVPEEAKQDGFENGDIVLRFVVGRDGEPIPATVELVRGRSLSLLKTAYAAVPSQHFTPATIHGCPVAQVVDYAFNFLSAEPPPKH
jgi:hypothetical protein